MSWLQVLDAWEGLRGGRGGLRGGEVAECVVVVEVEGVECVREWVWMWVWEREREWVFRLLKEGARGGMKRAGLGRLKLVEAVDGRCGPGQCLSGLGVGSGSGSGSVGSGWMVKLARGVLTE